MLRSFLFLILLITVFQGCIDSNEFASPEKFAKYFNEKKTELNPIQKHGNFKFEASYRPAELLELINNPLITQSQIDTIKENNKNKAYFTCHLYNDSLTVLDYLKQSYNSNYDSILATLFFHIQKCFLLKVGNSQIPCSFYQMEQTGNISPALTFDLTFETANTGLTDNWELVFNDSLVSKSSWNIPFDKDYINNIPKLTLHKK